MDWESFWNTVDYRVRERHLSQWRRTLIRHWHAPRGGLRRRVEAAQARREERRMEDTAQATAALQPETLGRLLLARLDEESNKAIVAAVRQELVKEVTESAIIEARRQLVEEFSAERTRLYDDVAQARERLWGEVEQHLAQARTHARTELDAEWAEEAKGFEQRIARLVERRKADKAVEAYLLDLLGQLLPKDQPTALWRRGLRTLDLRLLAPLLAKQGQRIRTEAGPPRSSLTVEVTFPDGAVRPCSLFVRESVHAEEAPLEATEAEEARA